MRSVRLAVAVLWALGVVAASAAGATGGGGDWTQFRGPNGQGHADGAQMPLNWSKTTGIVWRTPIPGLGWSSPVVSGGRIWMTTALEKGTSLRAVCVDAESGRIVHDVELFNRQAGLKVNAKNTHASPTPVLDGERVFVHFGAAGTACLDARTAQILWRTEELQLDHKEGPGASLIPWGQLLIAACDGIDVQYLAALDKASGKVVWRTKRSGKLRDDPDVQKAYCTPAIANVSGQDQVISAGADWLYGYEPATGKELWRVGFTGYSVVSVPQIGHGLAFVSTGFNRPELWAVRLGAAGDATATHVAWRYTKGVPAKPSPLLVGDELHMVSDTGIATCLDAKTGQELWKERLGGNFSASPLHNQGRVYFFAEEGKTTVIAAGRTFNKLAENDLAEYTMATPAPVGKAVFLRTAKALYRIE